MWPGDTGEDYSTSGTSIIHCADKMADHGMTSRDLKIIKYELRLLISLKLRLILS